MDIKMNEFKTYHPIVNFMYFLFVIGFSMFYMHPICLIISLFCGFTYSVILKGRKAVKKNLLYMLPALILMAIINPVFNHEGVTILTYLPGGNPLTLESVVYGISASVMIISVICHFSCYNEVMTSDKFIYLFGKIIPSLSLIICMTLRFVPEFISQFKTVINAQRCIGRDMSSGSLVKRIKNGIAILSIMITWSLENAVDTADSMKSRGYGLPGRSTFSVFEFDSRDKKVLLCILMLGIYVLTGGILGGMDFSYFPSLAPAKITIYRISLFAAYLLLCIMPVIIENAEVRKWKSIKSKD